MYREYYSKFCLNLTNFGNWNEKFESCFSLHLCRLKKIFWKEYSQESKLMELVAKLILIVMIQPECFDLLKLSREGKVVEPMRDSPSPLPLSKKGKIEPMRNC